jgi:hypothetical protein
MTPKLIFHKISIILVNAKEKTVATLNEWIVMALIALFKLRNQISAPFYQFH